MSDPLDSMARLLTLPHEILFQILEEVSPDDIEKFVMSCKQIYLLAKDTLRKHAAMKCRYEQIVCNYVGDFDDGSGPRSLPTNPAVLLRDVLVNERVRYYPREIFIGNCSDAEGHPFEGQNLQKNGERVDNEEFLADVQDSLLKSLHDCPFLFGNEAEEWNKMIVGNGAGEAIVSFLITLLPNLHSLYASDFEGFDVLQYRKGPFYHMMSRIAKVSSAFESMNRPRPPAIGKLSTVNLMWGEDLSVNDFAAYQPFVRLPSVRSIRGSSVITYDFAAQLELQNSDLECIYFLNCRIETPYMLKLFRGIKALKVFIYECVCDELACLNPNAIVTGLLEHASHSLTHLDLSVYSISKNRPINSYYVGSLQGFRALERIRLNEIMLLIPVSGSNTKRKSKKRRTEKIYPNYKVQQLVNILPKSVKVFQFAENYLWDEREILPEDYCTMLEGLPEQKQDHFPQLCEIRIRNPNFYGFVFRTACKEAGICLTDGDLADVGVADAGAADAGVATSFSN